MGSPRRRALPMRWPTTSPISSPCSIISASPRSVIVGLSVGGVIAQGLAALHPERVAALVLSDTAHKIGTEASWNERIDAVTRDGIASIADTIMQRWFTSAYRRPDNPDFAGYTAMLTRTPVDGYAGTCAALRDADLTESTRALKMPALCIVGDQDGATPPDLVRSMANLIRNSEFRIIPDAGHLPCIEQPDAVAGLIGSVPQECPLRLSRRPAYRDGRPRKTIPALRLAAMAFRPTGLPAGGAGASTIAL